MLLFQKKTSYDASLIMLKKGIKKQKRIFFNLKKDYHLLARAIFILMAWHAITPLTKPGNWCRNPR